MMDSACVLMPAAFCIPADPDLGSVARRLSPSSAMTVEHVTSRSAAPQRRRRTGLSLGRELSWDSGRLVMWVWRNGTPRGNKVLV